MRHHEPRPVHMPAEEYEAAYLPSVTAPSTVAYPPPEPRGTNPQPFDQPPRVVVVQQPAPSQDPAGQSWQRLLLGAGIGAGAVAGAAVLGPLLLATVTAIATTAIAIAASAVAVAVAAVIAFSVFKRD